jgi:hypothetical protein
MNAVPTDWLPGKSLFEAGLSREGVFILGIQRKNGFTLGSHRKSVGITMVTSL